MHCSQFSMTQNTPMSKGVLCEGASVEQNTVSGNRAYSLPQTPQQQTPGKESGTKSRPHLPLTTDRLTQAQNEDFSFFLAMLGVGEGGVSSVSSKRESMEL